MNKTQAALLAFFALFSSTVSASETDSIKYGRDITDYVSKPRIGGLVVGKYEYSDKEGSNTGDGFHPRYVRLSVEGTILRDFKYRVQAEFKNSPYLTDYYLEWNRYKVASLRFGQYKRPFSIDCNLHPCDVGFADYSQLSTKLAGLTDYIGDGSMGARDQGLMASGEFAKVGEDHHNLIKYQVGVFSGQGINHKDANSQKDLIGCLKFIPVKGLTIAAYGWTGNYTSGSITVKRDRWGLGAAYTDKRFTTRAEYAHSTGHKLSDFDAAGNCVSGRGKADAWYAMAGYNINRLFSVAGRYDVFRDQATWDSMKSVYSICAGVQPHRCLLFQVQYNYNNDKLSADHHYNSVVLEAYVRF
jgi:hypothetical protein